MDNAGYVAVARQSGLWNEMRTVANNIANLSTTGFRREGVVFSEYVDDLGDAEPSLSVARAVGRSIDLTQGVLARTGGTYDLAVEGDGFFMIATPEGNQLTRAGAFTLSADGTLVTADGYGVLDSGGAPIQIDPTKGAVSVGTDGTIAVGGKPVSQVGVFMPADIAELQHQAGTRFSLSGDSQPATDFRVFQGFLEGSNVNPVLEIARMIEVQRAYEMGQGLLDREDGRIRSIIQSTSR
jgi:flagellar basal-body rod protein FlgF